MKKTALVALSMLFSLSACAPKVEVALSNEPININLNVKIQHEIFIRVDKQLDELFSDASGLF